VNTQRRSLEALRAPIIPDRVRRIGAEGFAFLNHRFLRDGFFSSLDRDQLALYLFLVLAGNRDGVSFYRYDAICSLLRLTLDDYIAARNSLIERDFIAFDGTRYQVLSLPAPPNNDLRTPLAINADLDAKDPATIRAACLAALSDDD
jgi:hypothetical protein